MSQHWYRVGAETTPTRPARAQRCGEERAWRPMLRRDRPSPRSTRSTSISRHARTPRSTFTALQTVNVYLATPAGTVGRGVTAAPTTPPPPVTPTPTLPTATAP